MSTGKRAFLKAAATHGKVNPKDLAAVDDFYQKTIFTLSPKKRQAIFNDIFTDTTGLDATLGIHETVKQPTSHPLRSRTTAHATTSKKRAVAAAV